jgi:chromosome segregation ATPase
MQNQKISDIMTENNLTISTLNKKIRELNDTVNNLNTELENLSGEIIELENDLTQNIREYDVLYEKYVQLNQKYYDLLHDYRVMNTSYMREHEIFLNKTRVNENSIRIFFNHITFEYPQDLVTSLDGLYESVPTNHSGLFTGTSYDETTIITLSWNYVENMPDLNATIKSAYESIKKDVEKIGLNGSLNKEDFKILYVNYTITVDRETKYMLISTWYLKNASHHYLCIIQQEENIVIDTLKDLMSSFYRY